MVNYSRIDPINRIDMASEILKVFGMGGETVGFRVRRDIVYALGLKRGMLVKVTIEKLPESIVPTPVFDAPPIALRPLRSNDSL